PCRRGERLVPRQASVVEARDPVDSQRLRRDDRDRADRCRSDCLEHGREHRPAQLGTLLRGEGGAQPALRPVEALDRHQHVGRHRLDPTGGTYAHHVPRDDAFALAELPAAELLEPARRLRAQGKGGLVTYSPKVFIPLTKLCRDVCHYCTFAAPPRRGERAFMTTEEVLEIASAGAAAGCREALFTLGDKPELRYRVAREELAELGCSTTIEYLARMCRLVLEETGLLPHANPGVMTREDLALLREV